MHVKPAKVISVLFHPLLVPTYALLLFINLNTHFVLAIPIQVRYLMTLLVFLTTFMLPALILLILRKFDVIKSMEMPERQERALPLIIVSAFFYLTYYLLKQMEQYSIITLFMIGATMLILLCLIINYFTKISLHSTSWGGFLGALMGYSLNARVDVMLWLYAIILITGMVATARLILKAHTPAQVYGGFLLGSLSQLILFYYV
jgi:membrane-associated phospholipid phosphatase